MIGPCCPSQLWEYSAAFNAVVRNVGRNRGSDVGKKLASLLTQIVVVVVVGGGAYLGWEYRASLPFFGGDDADGYHFSAPVGSYARGISPYGVHDMAGNVWEFVSDWYDEGFYARSPMRNPEGPDSGLVRVLRGGSFGSDPRRLRTTDRSGLPPTPSYLLIGFRCAVAASSLPATAIRPLSWGVVKREAR